MARRGRRKKKKQNSQATAPPEPVQDTQPTENPSQGNLPVLGAIGAGLLTVAIGAYSLLHTAEVPDTPDKAVSAPADIPTPPKVEPIPEVPTDSGMSLDDRIAKAAQIVDAIPDTIPGAKKVEKYAVDGAQYVLAVCLQYHGVGNQHIDLYQFANEAQLLEQQVQLVLDLSDQRPADSSDADIAALKANLQFVKNERAKIYEKIERELDQICTSQKNIYAIFNYLLDNVGSFDLRPEGAMKDYTISDMVKVWLHTVKKPLLVVENGDKTADDIMNHDLRFYPGAEFMFAKERDIPCLQGGDEELTNRAFRLYEDYDNSTEAEWQKIVGEDREDFLVDLVGNQDNVFHVTKYGASHDFKDNVAKWNAAHPDRKISLVVITPKE